MPESSFSMPTRSSASFRVAAVLVPLETLITTTWIDADDGTTYVTVEHTPLDASGIERAVLRAHPKVTKVA